EQLLQDPGGIIKDQADASRGMALPAFTLRTSANQRLPERRRAPEGRGQAQCHGAGEDPAGSEGRLSCQQQPAKRGVPDPVETDVDVARGAGRWHGDVPQTGTGEVRVLREAAFGVHRGLPAGGQFQGGGQRPGRSRSGCRKTALSGVQQPGLLSAEDGGYHGELFRAVSASPIGVTTVREWWSGASCMPRY